MGDASIEVRETTGAALLPDSAQAHLEGMPPTCDSGPMVATTRRQRLAWLVLALPVALFYFLVARHAMDLPRGDDFISIVPFLNRWTDAASPGERFDLLFAQYNSHRIVLTRCAAALTLSFGGYFNFIWLQILGWIAWLGTAILVLGASPRVRAQPLLGLPVLLILMQPQGETNFFIAMQAVGNLGVLFLSFGALALLSARRWSGLVLALALAVLAPLASVNGLFVFPVAVAGLALKRQRGSSVWFLFVGALSWTLFFVGYSHPQTPFRTVEFLHNAAIMVGATVKFGTLGFGFATAAGGAILFLAAVVLLTAGFRQRISSVALLLLFICLSVAMAARGRIGWGPNYMDQDRYRVYGLLMISLIYLMLLEGIPGLRRRCAALSATCAAAFFCLISYASYLPNVTTQHNWTEATAINRQLGYSFFNITPSEWPVSLVEWQIATTRGLVHPPTPLSSRDLTLIASLSDDDSSTDLSFDARATSALYGFALAPTHGQHPGRPEFAVMLHQGRPLALPITVWRSTFREIPRRLSFYSDGFEITLPEPLYEPGPHSLYGLARNPGGELNVLWRARVELP
jgi:hypothetical protein